MFSCMKFKKKKTYCSIWIHVRSHVFFFKVNILWKFSILSLALKNRTQIQDEDCEQHLILLHCHWLLSRVGRVCSSVVLECNRGGYCDPPIRRLCSEVFGRELQCFWYLDPCDILTHLSGKHEIGLYIIVLRLLWAHWGI